MALTWIIVGAMGYTAYALYKVRKFEDKSATRPKQNLNVWLRQPIIDTVDSAFIHQQDLSSKDLQLEYVGPATRGGTKYHYRNINTGEKFATWRPVHLYLRS